MKLRTESRNNLTQVGVVRNEAPTQVINPQSSVQWRSLFRTDWWDRFYRKNEGERVKIRSKYKDKK